ncbi:MAG: phage/plasmid primase, P4 family, partial [Anaerolineales bacterium]|nr:phage/plasmid primase, P4 family [Anaerolineales bacterium]
MNETRDQKTPGGATPAPASPPAEAAGMAAAVEGRAAALLAKPRQEQLDDAFVKQCLDNNERGDGCMFAALHRGNFLYNVTPKDGEWYAWAGNVWTPDVFRRAVAGVEDCALEYQRLAEHLDKEMDILNVDQTDKKSDNYWMVTLAKAYRARAHRLRSTGGSARTLSFAPVVEPDMACRESDFDKHPDLLPVRNGVIDLTTGALVQGRPEDMLTRSLDLAYDPQADYAPWQAFVDEISDDPATAAFIKRTFGYAISGHSYEQHIWVFTGPGRNGKGVLFDLIGEVMRAYYHVISRSMLLEQRNEPGPSAASEHKYSLLGKRIVVGAETNRGQKIDAGAIKSLTGDDDIVCRPNFKSEIIFQPSHTLFLHTNHIPAGLTRDFALVQRLIKIEFPWMYVDDPAAEARKFPAWSTRFRRKDPLLKDKLRRHKPGILRWLVEGCLE